MRKATSSAFRDGWMETGDAGYFKNNGHLVVIDRYSDLAATADGSRYSPQFLENKLKFSPYIAEAVVCGDSRNFLSAMVCLRFEVASKWAERRRLSFAGYGDLASKPEISALIADEIRRANESLPPPLRIRRFVLLYKELDADDGELTSTKKIRRRVIAERYRDIIDAIYRDETRIAVDAEITLQDGGKQRIKNRPCCRAIGRLGKIRRGEYSEMNTELLLQLLLNGVIVGALYGVVAMCFVLIYKASRVVNFAQGEFLIIGAFACLWLVAEFSSFLFRRLCGDACLYGDFRRAAAGDCAASAGRRADYFRDYGNHRLVHFLSSDAYMAIRSRHAFFFRSVCFRAGGNCWGLKSNRRIYLILAASLITMAIFYWFFKFSRMGLAMRATAFDQQAAQSLGISVDRVFAAAWAISAMVSALAGVVLGLVNGISTALAFIGIKVFPAVILGGLDSIVGGVVGGIVIGVLENLAEFIDGQYFALGKYVYDCAILYFDYNSDD